MKSKPFDWGDAIITALYIIFGVIIIGTAKNNWFIALGALFMINGAIQSERNRRKND